MKKKYTPKKNRLASSYVLEAAKRERYCFDNIKETILNYLQDGESTFNVIVSPYYLNEPQDVIIEKTNTNTNVVTKFFIEIKNRSSEYSEFVLEEAKLTELKQVAKDPTDIILYINITPKQTYVWNITKLVKEKKLSKGKKEMNKSTCKSTEVKRTKRVRYVDYNDASMFIKFGFDENKYQLFLNPPPVVVVKKLNSIF